MSDSKKPLGWLDAVGLIVGIIVGAGVFQTPAKVCAAVSTPAEAMMLWIFGAIAALCGALCYAELAAAYPTDAGEAEYLTRAVGPVAGWYFTWVQLVCFRTAAAIVTIAYIFATYARELWPLPIWLYVTAVIVAVTGVNALGLRPGKWTQNTLATVKVLGLAAAVVAGFAVPAALSEEPLKAPDAGALAVAVVFIMYAYSGWHETAYIVGDLRDPRRSLPRAMFVGLALVVAVYLAINLAAIHSLGFAGLRESKTFGVQLLHRAGWSGRWFAALVVIVTMGSINGTILSGSRLFSTVGATQPGYGWLSRWRTVRDAPLAALFIQAAICLAFVAVVERAGTGADGFDIVVAATSPVLWVVFLSAGLALMILRWREPEHDRPYRVPFYPLVPIIYIMACLFMLWMSLDYAWSRRGPEMLWMLGLLALGLPYWYWVNRTHASSKRR